MPDQLITTLRDEIESLRGANVNLARDLDFATNQLAIVQESARVQVEQAYAAATKDANSVREEYQKLLAARIADLETLEQQTSEKSRQADEIIDAAKLEAQHRINTARSSLQSAVDAATQFIEAFNLAITQL